MARKRPAIDRMMRARVGFRMNPFQEFHKKIVEIVRLPTDELVYGSQRLRRLIKESDELRKKVDESAKFMNVTTEEIEEASKMRKAQVAALWGQVNPQLPLREIAEKYGVSESNINAARKAMKLGKRNKQGQRGKALGITQELETHIKNKTLKRGIQSQIAKKHGVSKQYVGQLLRNIQQKNDSIS